MARVATPLDLYDLCNDISGDESGYSSESDFEREIEAEGYYISSLKPAERIEKLLWDEIDWTCSPENIRSILKQLKDLPPGEKVQLSSLYTEEMVKKRKKVSLFLVSSALELNPYDALPSFINRNDLASIKFIIEDLRDFKDPNGKKYTMGDNIMSCVLRDGNFETLRYFMEDTKLTHWEIFPSDMEKFGRRGDLKMLKLIMEGSQRTEPLEVPFEECVGHILRGAAMEGKLEVIEYLKNKHGVDLCMENDMILNTARRYRQEKVVRYVEGMKNRKKGPERSGGRSGNGVKSGNGGNGGNSGKGSRRSERW